MPMEILYACTNNTDVYIAMQTGKKPMEFSSYWLGKTKTLKHAQFLCQFYELRKLDPHTGVQGYGFVAWFGQNTYIAFLVLLFGFTQPICTH